MRRGALLGLTVLTLALVVGTAACSSPSTAAARKTSFCAGNIKIDKASANTESDAAFLAVLKANKAAITEMADNLPSGSLGVEAHDLVSAAQRAISTNNINAVMNIPSSTGGDVDTYCGVDGSGNPLPAYFATGKSTSFCSTFLPIFNAVSNAGTSAATLSALESAKAQIAQLATEVSALPSSISADAQATVNSAQTALNDNSVNPLQSNSNAAQSVALYCGQNE
jgi:hypothetical protein